MANLPSGRPRTYVNGMPAVPDDINEIFDQFVDSKHNLITRPISPLAAISFHFSTGASGVGVYNTSPVFGGWTSTGVSQGLYVPLPVYRGERIVNVRAYVSCGATDAFQSHLNRLQISPGGGPSLVELGTAQSSSLHVNTIETLTYNNVDEATGNYNSNYFLELLVTNFANAPKVWGIEIDLDLL